MRAVLRSVDAGGVVYDALAFWCPGCETIGAGGKRHGGLHMLPVNSTVRSPSWEWDGNLDTPTLAPSILTTRPGFVCHSFLRAGVFEFLGDCTHALAGQRVELPELPAWVTRLD